MSDTVKYGLVKAVKHAGGVQQLADLLSVDRRTVRKWLLADGVTADIQNTYPESAIKSAVEAHGGPTAVAKVLGVTYQAVCEWMRQGYAPRARAQEMEMQFGVPRLSLMSPRLRNTLGVGGEL